MLNFIRRSERGGTGIRNIIGTYRSNGFPDLDFSETAQSETIMVMVPLTRNSNIVTSLKDRIANMISEDDKITTTEILQRLRVLRSTVTREISVMKRKGLLERIGDLCGRWSINRR